MSSRYFATLLAVVLAVMLFLPQNSHSQIVQATGNSDEAASQLIYWYDAEWGPQAATAQVTNTNDTTGVWIHVQIFRSFDPDGAAGPTPATICDERNFVDFLTPNDTHLYNWSFDNFFKNIGETEAAAGEATSIDLDGTKGFAVITPVVSESDFTAISFQHLIGTAGVSRRGEAFTDQAQAFRVNAMGRSAVDFTTGEVVDDGTPLDGTTNGFVVLQPEELIFDFSLSDDVNTEAFIVGMSFIDVYGPAGLQGYTVAPGSTNWQTFIFDWKEDPTSCGVRTNGCYFSIGLNDEVGDAENADTSAEGPGTYIDDELLCAGSDLPEFQDGQLGADRTVGWTRIFVSGYESLENQIGFVGFIDSGDGVVGEPAGASWMSTNR